MANNKHIVKRLVNGEAKNFCIMEDSGEEILARAVPAYYTKQLCKVKKWTYTDCVGDGGIDAVTPQGKKHIQIKVLADNESGITFTSKKYSSKEEIYEISDSEMLDLIIDYCKCFDSLIIYTTANRGDKFDRHNAIEYRGEDMVTWLYEHGRVSYMNVNNNYYAQIKLTKRAKRSRA